MPAPPPIAPDTSRRDWTVEQCALLPADGNRYEIVDGELLVTPAPSWLHQRAIRELVALLQPAARARGLDCLFAPADVALSQGILVQPDVFVVSRRTDGSLPLNFAEAGRLMLAIEVLSPASARADRHVKRAAYLAHGVPDYWVVDSANRFVERWRTGDDAPEILVESLAWEPSPGGAALRIDLPSYFRRVHDEDEGAGE